MTDLFAASEQESFATTGTLTSTTTTTFFDNTRSNGALTILNNSSIQASFAGNSEVWVHGLHWMEFPAQSGSAITLRDGTTEVLRIRNDGGNGKFQYHNGSVWVDIATGLNASLLQTIDIRCKIDTDGEFELYEGNSLTGSLSTDTTVSGATQIDNVVYSGNSINNPVDHSFSQIVIRDTSTRGVEFDTINMTGNGFNTAWTGDFTDIDEQLLNADGDFILSTSAGDLETFTAEDITLPANYSISSVVIGARVQRGAAGPQGMQIIERQNSTDYFGDDLTLNIGFEPKQQIFSVDQDTSVQWTESGVNSAEFGVRSRP